MTRPPRRSTSAGPAAARSPAGRPTAGRPNLSADLTTLGGPARRRSLLSRLSPPQLIALSFLAAIVVGAALLSLPVSLESGHTLSPLGALFMATSAVCVTGLAVVDPGGTFSVFGEVVLLLLIQMGGLGLITLGTLFALALRRRVGVSDRIRAAQQVSAYELGSVVTLVRRIVLSSLLVEAVGAALLAFAFVPREGLGRGLYFAVFHSVSSFNNAGFSLYASGLTGFVQDPLVNLVVPLLVILGGLGFLVQLNVLAFLRDRRRERLSLNSRLSLTMTAGLLLLGTAGFALAEWNNPATLGALPTSGKLMAAWFQGMTPRTAGFNTLDYGAMHYTTLFMTILLMFIGANPGSTGGGIKTNTFYIMMASAWSMVRGRRDTTLFRRRIDTDTILRAMTVGLLSIGLVNVMFVLMLALNTNPDVKFVQLFFETVSAFGTVGLSMNATPLLNGGQEAVLIILMFLGRIGPLTFAVAFSRPDTRALVRYPADKDILIG
ncbi:TrkH family potassium uptake protein [Deinococcus knuensis]|uniref:Potassium transporter KtrB n=1 Tax=Deinococcus knuensis TaxID=1837380 RepID=A0ABQ2SJ29_9DEIO|nr:TrkH family potassium uptake protein [Deinococcus knuensis]GGS31433.1 potassium transporter KtrB [Deinococcus knuensis]